MKEITITIAEEQRQGILLALACLAVARPGFDPAFLRPIAALMDDEGCPMYEGFKESNSDMVTVPATELERFRSQVDDLQSGMYINCVYCGHRYGPKDKSPTTKADVLKAHIAVCPEHPMSKLLSACRTAESVLLALQATWENSSPLVRAKLAEMQKEIQEAILSV